MRGVKFFGAAGRALLVALIVSFVGIPRLPAQTQNTTTLPQSAPPASNDYCFEGQCFASLALAKQAMRASIPNGDQLKQISASQAGGVIVYQYALDDTTAETIYETGYGDVNVTSNCRQPNSPPAPVLNMCASESEMLALQLAKTREEGVSNCTYSQNITGQFVLPYSSITEFMGYGIISRGITRNGYEREDHILMDCQGDQADFTFPLVSFTAFNCPEKFAPRFALHPQNMPEGMSDDSGLEWPKICKFKEPLKITAKIKQECSASAAQSQGHPCHPSTGDKSRSETDFEFAGVPFTRTYHSLQQAHPNPSLPVAWMFPFQERLFASDNALLTGNGYYARLIRIDENTFEVTGDSGSRLEKQQDGGYIWKSINGETRQFDQFGALVAIEQFGPRRERVSITYQGQPPFMPGQTDDRRIQTVTDSAGRELRFAYADGRISQISLPDGSNIGYRYDALGNLVAVDYGSGILKRYLYGEPTLAPNGDLHLLTGIISESGRRYGTFGYDQSGRVIYSALHGPNGATETTELSYVDATHTSVRTMTGELQTYTYSSSGSRNLISLSSIRGSDFSEYDDAGRQISYVDYRGHKSEFSYSSQGRLAQKTEAANDTTGNKRTIQTDWHPTFNVPVERRILNAANTLVSKETWTHNARGQVLTHSSIDPTTNAARTTTTTYCEDAATCGRVGLVLSVNGPRTDVNDTTTYQYYLSDDVTCAAAPTTCPHRKGDLWKVTNALGQTTETLAYDGAGRVLSVKDASGLITDFTYTPRGWLATKTVRGDGTTANPDRKTKIEYWPTGLVSFVTQPDGSFTAFTYDDAHRLTDVYDNVGNKIHYTLDNAGNRTKEDTTDPSGTLTRTLSRVYNQLGQLQQSLTANQHATTYAYDGNGNTIGVTDALGRNTGNAYDPLNRLTLTLQDTAGIKANTQFAYDANDNLTEVTDPKGLKTSYGYNGLGDLTTLASPDSGTTQYTYDAAGNRLTQTDARGVTAQYGYDALNRLRSISYPNASFNQGYTYDSAQSACPVGEQNAVGQLTAMQSRGASTQYCYDRWGQLVRKLQTIGSLTQVTRYGYDAYGRQNRIVYPDGGVVDTTRNALGQVSEVGYTPANSVRRIIANGITYAPFGPATQWTYGNGRTLNRSLTLDYRPAAIQDSQPGGLSYAYGFDAVGNLGALKDGPQTQDLGKFVYDGLNRLTQQQTGNGAPLNTWAYDATGNRLSAQSGSTAAKSYVYPAASHRLDKVATTARSYDAVGNTVSIGGSTKTFAYGPDNRMLSVSASGAVKMNYGYNARGELVKRNIGTTTYTYAYDEAGHLIGEYTGTGLAVQQMIYLDDAPIAVVNGRGATQAVHYVEPDHLGTPRVIIDGTRNVAIWSWPLLGEAFGASTPNQDPDGDGKAFTFNLRFPGQRYDSATGLNYNYFRDYEPQTGRYVQSDPIGLRAGPSTYGYVGGAPLTWRDSSGLLPGQCYKTADEAAANALADINPRSTREDREYAGWIYRTANGWYSYGAPAGGSAHHSNAGVRPPGGISDYHTHGAFSGPGYSDEAPSPGDWKTTPYGQTNYLGTPSGRFIKYKYNGRITEISKPEPGSCGEDCSVNRNEDWVYRILNSIGYYDP